MEYDGAGVPRGAPQRARRLPESATTMTYPASACVNASELESGDLLAYVAGEPRSGVEDHLERCPACRADTAAYAELQRRLQTTFLRQSCPPALTLAEYALGVLAPQARQTMAAHLVECPHCRAEQRDAVAFLTADYRPQARGVLAGIRRFLAQPMRPAPALAGLRGAAGAESVTYDADGARLTIGVQSAARGGTFVIAGLVEDGQRFENASITLFKGEILVEARVVDDLGSFSFEAVTTGVYRLELQTGDLQIEVDPLTVETT